MSQKPKTPNVFVKALHELQQALHAQNLNVYTSKGELALPSAFYENFRIKSESGLTLMDWMHMNRPSVTVTINVPAGEYVSRVA